MKVELTPEEMVSVKNVLMIWSTSIQQSYEKGKLNNLSRNSSKQMYEDLQNIVNVLHKINN
jgi:hypothetical protein